MGNFLSLWYLSNVNHLIFVATNFGAFKRLKYQSSLILAVSKFNNL